MNQDLPFWKTKPLAAMNRAEWESLCDGCGRCCLNKIEYEDTGEVLYTDVGCRLLDCKTARCLDYSGRFREVPDCVAFDAGNISAIHWMPATCAYRLLAERRDLFWWHPLVSGDRQTVIEAGISVSGRIVSETTVDEDDFLDHVVTWPQLIPIGPRADNKDDEDSKDDEDKS